MAGVSDISLCAAIDVGGTNTRAALIDGAGRCIARANGPGANPIAYGRGAALRVITGLVNELTASGDRPLGMIAAGIAGAGDAAGRKAMAAALFSHFHVPRIIISGDAPPVIVANRGFNPAVLAVAGTGSIVIGLHNERAVRVGGLGMLCGEEGAAYGIAMDAICAAGYAIDGMGPATVLTHALHEHIGLDSFDSLCRWPLGTSKDAVASLARVVTAEADQGDTVAQRILDHQAGRLARQVEATARKLDPDDPIDVFAMGGLIEGSRSYYDAFATALQHRVSRAAICELKRTGPEAIAAAARETWLPPEFFNEYDRNALDRSEPIEIATESHDDGPAIDAMDPAGIARHLAMRDSDLAAVVAAEAEHLGDIIEAAANAIEGDGRLIYVGAGTSGRLGLLDASECPPTFGVAPEKVQGIIAGGEAAVIASVEGAEDDDDAGRAAVSHVTENDVVIGIAASGRTPFTIAAIAEARRRGAFTGLICCNPNTVCPAVNVHVILETGPEAIAGSTRLRAGTATKMALNIISTGALASAGYVLDGYMVGVQPTNAKLVARAEGIVETIAKCSPEEAKKSLLDAQNDVPIAIVIAVSAQEGKRLSREQAELVLMSGRGALRKVLSLRE